MIHETLQARNDLEGYVLDMRGRLSGDLAAYIKDADKEAFLSRLNAEEEWLYNDGFDSQKSEYKKRLGDLKQTGDAVLHRFNEHHERDAHVAALKSAIGHYSQWATSNSEEKYAHIGADDRKKVADECAAVDQWLAQVLSAQDKLTPADQPAVTVKELTQRKTALDQVVHPIMHKPKPAPKKEEATKKEEAAPKPEEAAPKPEEANKDSPAAEASPAPEAEAKPADDSSKPMEH